MLQGEASISLQKSCEYIRDSEHVLDIRKPGTLTGPWKAAGYARLSFGWTPDRILLRCAVNNTGVQGQYYLHSDWPVGDVWEVYLPDSRTAGDGSKVSMAGSWYLTGDQVPYFERPGPSSWGYTFPLAIAEGSQYIYLRLESRYPVTAPLLLQSPQQWHNRTALYQMVMGGVLLIMVFMLVFNTVIFFALQERRYIYYVGFLINFTLFSLAFSGIGRMVFWHNSPGITGEILGTCAGLFTLFLAQFGRSWFKGQSRLLAIVLHSVSAVGLASSILEIFTDYLAVQVAIWNGIAVMVLGTPIILYLVLVKKIKGGMMWLVATSALFTGMLIWLAMNLGFFPAGPLGFGLMPLGVVFCSLILSLTSPLAVDRMRHEIAGMNENLQETITEVNALNEKQHGDYMLTSFLLDPLQKIGASTSTVTVEKFVRQFKQFDFRSRSYEIGGDICISERILLGEKHYTFFLNGDAMGKSIQGAGGALVLGSAARASLTQARLGKSWNILPELWLRDTFRDINELFRGFDGAMLMSAVMGILDEQSGMVYYINAEHPWVVLYRDSKAGFLETELSMHKMGMDESVSLPITIQYYQMQKGDTLILGSDGRDDIVLMNRAEKKFNEDENLFLEWVEKGEGDPNRIAAAIMGNAEVKDDLSLMSITYNRIPFQPVLEDYADQLPDVQEGFEKYQSNIEILSRDSWKNQDWKAVADLRYHLFELDPTNTPNMAKLYVAWYRTGNYQRAADLGEVLLLREPQRIEFLSNQALLFKKMGVDERARELSMKLLELEPEHPTAARILSPQR
jgi:tetratricopeptide (TPR) repeat protein